MSSSPASRSTGGSTRPHSTAATAAPVNRRRRSGRYRLVTCRARATRVRVRRLGRPGLDGTRAPKAVASRSRTRDGVDARAPRPGRALPVHPDELPLSRPPRGLEPPTSAAAHGVVTRRESDGRFAFVEIAVVGRRRDRPCAGRRRPARARREGRARLLRRSLADGEARLPLDRQRRGASLSATRLDVAGVRARFTALQRRLAFFDGPGGTQCPDEVIDAISQLPAPRQRQHRRAVRDVKAARRSSSSAHTRRPGRFLGCSRRRGRVRPEHDVAELPPHAGARPRALAPATRSS